jgi:hypothetical protein
MKLLTAVNRPSFRAGLVRAAGDRRDQVDVALAHRRAVVREGDAPRGALAFREVLRLVGARETLALEQRHHRLGRERLLQVVAQAALVGPHQQLGLLARLLDRERHRDARHQHRLAAQQVDKLGARQVGVLEVARVGPHAHARAVAPLAGRELAHRQRHRDVAARERERGALAFAEHRHLELLRERVGDTDADAMQPAREAVGTAAALVELAARVQPGEHDLDDRHLLFGMQAERDAAAVVVHRDRAVGVLGDRDALAMAGQRLVGRVVDHLLHDVQRVVGARVHARALLDRLQALQDADGTFGIFTGLLGFGASGALVRGHGVILGLKSSHPACI